MRSGDTAVATRRPPGVRRPAVHSERKRADGDDDSDAGSSDKDKDDDDDGGYSS